MQHAIVTFGYLAVFALMLAESACVPIPSEVTMLFAGAMAAGAIPDGRLNIVAVILAGVLGNVAGSYLAWAVGRYAGQAALRRWGRHLRLREEDLDRAHHWFTRHGPASVFFGRLLPVIRTFISLPAGFAGMAPSRGTRSAPTGRGWPTPSRARPTSSRRSWSRRAPSPSPCSPAGDARPGWRSGSRPGAAHTAAIR